MIDRVAGPDGDLPGADGAHVEAERDAPGVVQKRDVQRPQDPIALHLGLQIGRGQPIAVTPQNPVEGAIQNVAHDCTTSIACCPGATSDVAQTGTLPQEGSLPSAISASSWICATPR